MKKSRFLGLVWINETGQVEGFAIVDLSGGSNCNTIEAMSQTPPTSSKLFIRSEVLAAIDYLNMLETPSKQDKQKQTKRLQAITDQVTVQQILIKELQRTGIGNGIQTISELLMDLGTIELLQEPLWALIQSPHTTDEVKDASNLILRQLGDQTDPNLYLDYLEDPEGLINRETERMLEVSTRNPEALIDFIDFIYTLPVDEQCNLLSSLMHDHSPDYLLNIYFPTMLAVPPLETQELLLGILSQIRLPRVAYFLYTEKAWFQNEPRLARLWKKAVSTLKIAGIYREDQMSAIPASLPPHPVVGQSKIYECYATLPDGIGNQGIVFSREHENGDILMMSAAINDMHGILDCFGFYELSKADFNKLTEKFHMESTKIHADPQYCVQKLMAAEALNQEQQFRVPYEYSCWKVIFDDVVVTPETQIDLLAFSEARCNERWEQASMNLYQHPDFSTWFLEEGDHPVVTQRLEDVLNVVARAIAEAEIAEKTGELASLERALLHALDELGETMVHELLATDWRNVLIRRLADSAYLLHAQQANTFSALAATEVQKLRRYENAETPLSGFIRQYGRRCIEEDLLRLKRGTQKGGALQNLVMFEHLIDTVLMAWEV